MVDWPGRGNTGKESAKRHADKLRDAKEPPHGSSMTAVAVAAGKFYSGNITTEGYNPDTDRIETKYIDDRSVTQSQHLALFDKRGGLLQRSNPFAYPKDFKRMTARTKRIKLDDDSTRYEDNRLPIPTITLDNIT